MDSSKIGILTSPLGKSGILQLSHLLKIISAINTNFFVISDDEDDTGFFSGLSENISVIRINRRWKGNRFTRIIFKVIMQLKISLMVLKLNKNVDVWILFGSSTLSIPLIISKLLGKKIIMVLIGCPRDKYTIGVSKILVDLCLRVNFRVCDKIILYSKNLINEWDLIKYEKKILIGHEHFLNFNNYSYKVKFNERMKLVGYVGRLSQIKGILNFATAIPEILQKETDITFLIIGDGELKDQIAKYLDYNGLSNRVSLAGWVPHHKLPEYLNHMKLLVLPSYSEGLPNIVLESMACGTPVLATNVGSIPDIIDDGINGFILDNNEPAQIAKAIINTLNGSGLENVAMNSQIFVKNHFTYENSVKIWNGILESVESEKS